MPARSRLWILAAAVVPLALVAGCGEDSGGGTDDGGADPGATVSVREAAAKEDGPLRVRGYVIVNPRGEARICEGLLGSFPPQCGGSWLTVEGLDAANLPGREEEQGVVWTGETELSGTKHGSSLRVD